MSITAQELLDAGAADSIVDSAGCTPRDVADALYRIYVRQVFEGGNLPLNARSMKLRNKIYP